MAFLRIILLVSVFAGSYCFSPKCFAYREIECPNFVQDISFPETAEELRQSCEYLLPLGKCIMKAIERCAQDEEFEDNEEDVQIFRSILSFMESSCDEDSRIFRVISSEIKCVASTVKNMDDVCYWWPINGTLKDKLIDMSDGCIIDAWTRSCISARFDVECGEDTRDAVSDILENGRLFSPCSAAASEVSQIEKVFKAEFLQGRNAEEAIPAVIATFKER